MPIRINLLAESLAEEEMRRRDPVKRAIYIGVLVIVFSLVWFSSTLLESMLAKRNYNTIQMEIQSKSNDCVVVRSNLKKIDDSQKRLEALNKLSAARFFQGTLLNALQQIYVPNVQLIRIRVEQDYTSQGGVAAVTNKFGVVSGHPPTCTERILLTLDAKDSSPNPGDLVNHYKDNVLQSGYFKSCLASNNAVRLSSLTPPQTSFDSRPYVIFSLECRYQDKTR